MSLHRDRQSPVRKLEDAHRAKQAKRRKRFRSSGKRNAPEHGCDSHFVLNISYIKNEEHFNWDRCASEKQASIKNDARDLKLTSRYLLVDKQWHVLSRVRLSSSWQTIKILKAKKNRKRHVNKVAFSFRTYYTHSVGETKKYFLPFLDGCKETTERKEKVQFHLDS